MRSGATRAVAIVLGCLAAAERADGHGVVGQRSFIEPFIAEDANPKNEFVIGRPEWDHGREGRTLSVGFGLEKKLADRFSLTLDSEWLALYPDETGEDNPSGFANLGLTLKYAFLVNPVHEAIVSAALESTAPTGTTAVGAGVDPSFKPFLLYGKGAGDLPSGLGYLRPFAVQGDAGFEITTDRERSTSFAHNLAVQYSIPYLESAVRDFGLPWPLGNLIGDVEFNFEHGVNGEEQGKTTAIVTPGVVYMDRWVEVGVAGRFPLNSTTHQELDWGIVFIVDLFIDDLFPWTRWQPIGGMSSPTPMPARGES